MSHRIPTIGVFDSGVGGLTVLGALLKQASAADYLYLGDTARLPYGSKSQATVARYAVSRLPGAACAPCDNRRRSAGGRPSAPG